MSVFSGTTALYVGTTSYSKAYVGDTQVWPISSETYTLYTCIYGDNQGNEGRNYIILPFNTSGDLKVRFQGEVLYTSGAIILGGTYSADTYDYRFLYTSNRVYLDMGSQRVYKAFAMTGLTDFTISNFKIHNNVTGLDILTGATVTNVPDTEPFRVNMSKLKLTAISAWTGDTLIFAGVPAQRNSDGALGILDTLTNNFYTPLYPEYMYGCEPIPPVSDEYLTFEILSGGTIQLSGDCVSAQTVQYKVNNGSWNNMRVYGATASDAITVNAGDIVRWKGTNTTYAVKDNSPYTYSNFKGSAYFNVKGDIKSLLYGDNFIGQTTLPGCLKRMFVNSNVVSAEELLLSATNLPDFCFVQMFWGCQSLTTAPIISGSTAGAYTCSHMFSSSLDQNLTSAPSIFVNTLGWKSFSSMFSSCRSLNYVRCTVTNISADGLDGWMNGVSATGTFVKKSGVTFPTGDSGIPNNWTIIEEP